MSYITKLDIYQRAVMLFLLVPSPWLPSKDEMPETDLQSEVDQLRCGVETQDPGEEWICQGPSRSPTND